jgi:hypothetical protein
VERGDKPKKISFFVSKSVAFLNSAVVHEWLERPPKVINSEDEKSTREKMPNEQSAMSPMSPMLREERHRDKARVTDLSLDTIQDQLAQLATIMA